MIVVDTSVAYKWLVPEDDSAKAEDLFGLELYAPDFILLECGNAMWKRALRNEVSAHTISESLAMIERLVSLIETPPLVERALKLAITLKHAIYDCSFLALAERMSIPLITADAKFERKVSQSTLDVQIALLRNWSAG